MTREEWEGAAEGGGLIRGNDEPEWVDLPDNVPGRWFRAIHCCEPGRGLFFGRYRPVDMGANAHSIGEPRVTHLLWVGRCGCGAVLMGCSAVTKPAGHPGRSRQTTL